MIVLQEKKPTAMSLIAPGAQIINCGLYWDGTQDLDTAFFLCDENMKVTSENDVIYYANMSSGDGSVNIDKDCLNGASDSQGSSIPGVPDENGRIDFSKLDPKYKKIVYGAWIFRGASNFGQVPGAGVSISDISGTPDVKPDGTNAGHKRYREAVAAGKQVAKFNLSAEFNNVNAAALVCWTRQPDNSFTIENLGLAVDGGRDGLMSFFDGSAA